MKAVIMMFLLWFRKSCDTVVLKSDTCSKHKSFTHAQSMRVLLTMGSYKNILVKSVLFEEVTQKRQILNNVSKSDDRCLLQSVIWWDLTGGVELDYTLSRSLAISNFLNRKWAAEVEHFRPRPPAQSKIGDSSLSFFLPLDSTPSWAKSLFSPPRSRIRMLVSVELFGLGRKLTILLSPIINSHIDSEELMSHSVTLKLILYEYIVSKS